MKNKINHKIKISSIKESELVQNKAFSLGYFWSGQKDKFLYRNENSSFLFIGKLKGFKLITFANKEEIFNASLKKEISIEEFLKL
jgi:hypothetical protein